MTAKTTAQRQAAMKASRELAGLKKLHNLWAKPENHAVLKAIAAALDGRAMKKGHA